MKNINTMVGIYKRILQEKRTFIIAKNEKQFLKLKFYICGVSILIKVFNGKYQPVHTTIIVPQVFGK